MHPYLLLTPEQTRLAEKKANEVGSHGGGVSSTQLMERAGSAVVQLIEHLQKEQQPALQKNNTAEAQKIKSPTIAILCGPGNNGGDGFVIARLLKEKGWNVRVGLYGERSSLKGDAAFMADLFDGKIQPMTPAILDGVELIVDAIVGIGISRPIEGPLAEMIGAVNSHSAEVIAVDIPSGINANDGTIMGTAIIANRTLTFITRKPGHVLLPGRVHCGITDIAAIGIADPIIASLSPNLIVNDIGVWGQNWPRPNMMTHKYERGSVAVLSGGVSSTGAARLSARGALRIGAGVVTVLSPPSAVMVHANHLTSIMIESCNDLEALTNNLSDPRLGSVVAGPGLGLDDQLKNKILTVLKSHTICVIDADGLTGFADDPQALFKALRPTDILTPHHGEFVRLFPDIDIEKLGRVEAARMAADLCGAIIVYKGADTIIASPDGRASINVNAPPALATAGSGDVLAGFIAGLVSVRAANGQGSLMPSFDAAMAGVWFHGAVGQSAGPGLIAEDLPDAVPTVIRQIYNVQ